MERRHWEIQVIKKGHYCKVIAVDTQNAEWIANLMSIYSDSIIPLRYAKACLENREYDPNENGAKWGKEGEIRLWDAIFKNPTEASSV